MGAAEADYQRLLELERSSQHFQAYSRFLVEEKRGDYERAVAVMRQAVREDPLDADNWSHLGAAQYMTGDPAAKQSFERFLALVDTSVPENADRARWIRSYLARGTPARKPHGRARAAADGASSP
jgi:cytochrome c-type biogenesis protein CcmH/NrfG